MAMRVIEVDLGGSETYGCGWLPYTSMLAPPIVFGRLNESMASYFADPGATVMAGSDGVK